MFKYYRHLFTLLYIIRLILSLNDVCEIIEYLRSNVRIAFISKNLKFNETTKKTFFKYIKNIVDSVLSKYMIMNYDIN